MKEFWSSSQRRDGGESADKLTDDEGQAQHIGTFRSEADVHTISSGA
ncbi:hypothetical protein [Thermaerobacillus caldiproteolyticus]|nr:hypothetical protein [Anoxybacillus caldiproteolyticus]